MSNYLKINGETITDSAKEIRVLDLERYRNDSNYQMAVQNISNNGCLYFILPKHCEGIGSTVQYNGTAFVWVCTGISGWYKCPDRKGIHELTFVSSNVNYFNMG